MEQLDGGLAPIGRVDGLVDLAHAAAPEQDAEPERADDLIGEPAGAADLERAIELGARLGEQGVALGDVARGALELRHRVEREALADARREERGEVERLVDRDERDLIERPQAGHVHDAAVAEQAGRDAEAEHAVDDGDDGVHEGRDARARAEAEEVDAVDEHRRHGRGRAPVVDAGHRACHGEEAGQDHAARRVRGLIAEHEEHPDRADERASGADEQRGPRDRIAARDERDDDAAEAEPEAGLQEDARPLHLVEAHRAERRVGGAHRGGAVRGLRRRGRRGLAARRQLLRRQVVDGVLRRGRGGGGSGLGALRRGGRGGAGDGGGREHGVGIGGVEVGVVDLGGLAGVWVLHHLDRRAPAELDRRPIVIRSPGAQAPTAYAESPRRGSPGGDPLQPRQVGAWFNAAKPLRLATGPPPQRPSMVDRGVHPDG
ncbi:MAG TPA: hypothetical protein VNO30_38510 [Kofleriaceae bacterium]|nr:hypothetical protein [Kofleriaceae bacterium]